MIRSAREWYLVSIGTFDWSNDQTISNTRSVNRFPFIKPGTTVELVKQIISGRE